MRIGRVVEKIHCRQERWQASLRCSRSARCCGNADIAGVEQVGGLEHAQRALHQVLHETAPSGGVGADALRRERPAASQVVMPPLPAALATFSASKTATSLLPCSATSRSSPKGDSATALAESELSMSTGWQQRAIGEIYTDQHVAHGVVPVEVIGKLRPRSVLALFAAKDQLALSIAGDGQRRQVVGDTAAAGAIGVSSPPKRRTRSVRQAHAARRCSLRSSASFSAEICRDVTRLPSPLMASAPAVCPSVSGSMPRVLAS